VEERESLKLEIKSKIGDKLGLCWVYIVVSHLLGKISKTPKNPTQIKFLIFNQPSRVSTVFPIV
jgi:hypothetical protein